MRGVAEWIFCSFALIVSCLAVFDTDRLIRLLAYGRKIEPTTVQLWTLRVPGVLVVTGILWRMLINLVGRS